MALERIETHPSARPQGLEVRLASGVRNATVALASAGVLVLLVFYAIAAPTVSMSASVGPVVPKQGATAVVLGRVLTSGGGGLDGARIAVHRDGQGAQGGRGQGAVMATSDPSGSFRLELAGSCATYDISVRAHAEGSDVGTTATRRLCPGDALPIDAHVVSEGHFLWVPGPR